MCNIAHFYHQVARYYDGNSQTFTHLDKLCTSSQPICVQMDKHLLFYRFAFWLSPFPHLQSETKQASLFRCNALVFLRFAGLFTLDMSNQEKANLEKMIRLVIQSRWKKKLASFDHFHYRHGAKTIQPA